MNKYDFVAIDFETATSDRTSACAIGIVAVKDLEIVDSFSSLIRPESLEFSQYNVSINGITKEMVKNAPTFAQLWSEIERFIVGGVPIVAHNTSFDIDVLCKCAKIERNDLLFFDTIKMVRPYISGSKKLNLCCKHFGVCLEHHHDAISDAEATAKLAIEILRLEGCRTMFDYICKPRKPDAKPFSKTKTHEFGNYVRVKDFVPDNQNVDTSSKLFGHTVVFTGELSISRRDAMQLAVDCGAILKTSVSKRTDYLIVGVQDISVVGEDGMSTKEERAHALNAEGKANIKIIGEEEFLQYVGKAVNCVCANK